MRAVDEIFFAFRSPPIMHTVMLRCATPPPDTLPPASDAGSPTGRPKRGRRRKRPELSNEERRQLRAAQNREATRRSRERVRRRSAQLRLALAQSHQHAASLRAERDNLAAVVARATTSFPTHNARQGAMSLAVILNPPDHSPTPAPVPPLALPIARLPIARLSSPVSSGASSALSDPADFTY